MFRIANMLFEWLFSRVLASHRGFPAETCQSRDLWFRMMNDDLGQVSSGIHVFHLSCSSCPMLGIRRSRVAARPRVS
jgi:hypothetical protein